MSLNPERQHDSDKTHYADPDTLATLARLERENADLRARLEGVRKDAERWRYWRTFWLALCRMEVSRFARIDLTRKHVQSPSDMDDVTDAAIAQGKGEK